MDKPTPMIDPAYRKEHAKREPDWPRKFLMKHAYSPEQLPEGSKKKPKDLLDEAKVRALAAANNLEVDKFFTSNLNAGQVVMNVNNVFRAAARKRFGLKDADGKFSKVPEGDPLIEGLTRTHDKDGNALVTKSAEKPEQAAA